MLKIYLFLLVVGLQILRYWLQNCKSRRAGECGWCATNHGIEFCQTNFSCFQQFFVLKHQQVFFCPWLVAHQTLKECGWCATNHGIIMVNCVKYFFIKSILIIRPYLSIFLYLIIGLTLKCLPILILKHFILLCSCRFF
jgi:hypothetical protein